jgi:hypothetical protein
MFVLLMFLLASALTVNYQLTKKIPIPGHGGWDYRRSNRQVNDSHPNLR